MEGWGSGSGPRYDQVNAADYTTKLAPNEELMFQTWSYLNGVRDVDNPQSYYDYRGFWKALMTGDPVAVQGANTDDNTLHFPDKWKIPGHPSFSTQSQYYQPGTEGRIRVGDWMMDPETGKWMYIQK